MQDDDVKSGFIRQRRSLIATSLILLCLQSIGLSLNKITFFGNELSIQNPQILPLALWVAYIYFLIRYYQYFHDLSNRGVKDTYERNLNNDLIAWAFSKGKLDFAADNRINDSTKFYFGNPTPYFHEYKPWTVTIEGKAPVSITSIINNSAANQASEMTFRHRADWGVLLRFKIRASLHVCCRTRLVSEYYLPFIIALTPWLWLLKNLAG